MAQQKGDKNSKWKGGKYKHSKGYIEISAGPNRKQLEHRVIAKEAWGPRVPWNPDFEVHHMDAKRDHNCRGNLLILPSVLHHASAGYNKRKRNGRST